MQPQNIEAILNEFDDRLNAKFKSDGLNLRTRSVYYEPQDVVVVPLPKADALLETDGLAAIVEMGCKEVVKRGYCLHPLNTTCVLDLEMSFDDENGKSCDQEVSLVFSHNRFHKKTQVLVGLREEAKPFAEMVDRTIRLNAKDGQNRVIGKPVP